MNSTSTTRAERAAPARTSIPRQIPYIIGNEGCERFSFYGMSSVLTIYMARHLGFPDSDAEANYHLFVFAAFLTPLAGAWLAGLPARTKKRAPW